MMSKDTIYREDAIEALKGREDILHDAYTAVAIIRSISSADRPQGEWIIEIDANGNTYGRCSICGMKQYAGQLNYCPDCGARMKGADDE